MMPFFRNGDFILGWRFCKLRGLRRYQVIVFRRGKQLYIKRVVALPGEQVEVRPDLVLVNGLALVEPYTEHFSRRTGKWDLGQGDYFVLGDNRKSSVDSRSFGPIGLDQVLGIYGWPLPILSWLGGFIDVKKRS